MVRLRTPEFRGKVSYGFTEQGGKPPCISPTSEGSLFERFYFRDLISASLYISKKYTHHFSAEDSLNKGACPLVYPSLQREARLSVYFQDLISASLITKMRFHLEVKDKNDQAR
jgi:hypothetical protein